MTDNEQPTAPEAWVALDKNGKWRSDASRSKAVLDNYVKNSDVHPDGPFTVSPLYLGASLSVTPTALMTCEHGYAKYIYSPPSCPHCKEAARVAGQSDTESTTQENHSTGEPKDA